MRYLVRGLLVVSLVLMLAACAMNISSSISIENEDNSSSSTAPTQDRAGGPTGWINGTVKAKGGVKPLFGCLIEVANTTINTLTDANGTFSLKVSANARYEIMASKLNYTAQTLTSGTVPVGKGIWLNFTLTKKTATIHAKFSNVGSFGSVPFNNKFTIVNHTDAKYFKYETAMTQDFGETQCEVPAPGTYDVIGEAPTFGEGTIVETVTVNPGDFLLVQLDTTVLQSTVGSVLISVFYTNGTAAAGVSLLIKLVGAGTTPQFTRTTNAKGQYLHETSAGKYNITVTMEGFVKETKTVNITKRKTVDANFTLKVEPKRNNEKGNTLIYIIIAAIIALVVLSGVAAVTLVMVRKRKKAEEAQAENEYVCPKCGTVADEKDVKCKKCKFKFPWKQFRCPECGKLLDYNARKCTGCGNTEFELK